MKNRNIFTWPDGATTLSSTKYDCDTGSIESGLF